MTTRTETGYGFAFEGAACEQCPGHCCTGPKGYVWVTIDEMQSIAELLEIELLDFAMRYTKRVGQRYSLRELERGPNNFACVFFSEGCQIYNERPEHCRRFPFWPQHKGKGERVARSCPGIVLSPTALD